MKKLLAMLLLVSMILTLAACGDDKPGPGPVGPGTEGPAADGTEGAEGDDPAETEEPEEEEPEYYVPDPEAKYGGMVGIGVEAGTAYFDNLKVLSKQSNKMVLLNTTLDKEDVMPEFTNGATAAVIVDPSEEYKEDTAEEKKNHVISSSDTMAYTGDKEWNFYQYSLKVLPADETSVINVYFCIEDENNYFVLTLGEEGNTKADCYQVVNGEKASAAFKINNTLPLDTWTAVGITVERDRIDIYISGSMKMSLFNPDFVNQYYEYNGEIIPASISVNNYGAPVENGKYYAVDPANVIHDGKGTWSNATNTIATMAFDMDTATFYDCDEKEETPDNIADVLPGIPGDGTFATSYVGAYFEEGIKLTHIRFCPRSDQAGRMLNGTFEASEDGTNWVVIGSVDESPAANDFVTLVIEDTETAYKYVRYVGPTEGYGNVAEIEFWGVN